MMTTRRAATARTREKIHVETWGEGTPVVLVHGSLALATEEWEQQRPLASEGFRLLVVDRRGYGRSPAADAEDFVADAEDIAELMGDGSHLVGHSYGGLGVLLAAARRPAETLSLTLLEPATFALGQGHAEGRAFTDRIRQIWNTDVADDQWVVDFLKAIGSDPDEFPPEFLAATLPLIPLFRRGRPGWDIDVPFAELATCVFPKVVVSGGHSRGFDAICDDLARRIAASRAVVDGASHEIQFAGDAINELLLSTWRQPHERSE
jgi:pimeloyl-ACP methyl ester carboxylesterase